MKARREGWLRPKVALALGGGGARGLAHIGVLRILEAEGIPVDLIAGTSMGAVVGSLYAVYGSPAEAEARLRDFLDSPHFQRETFQRLMTMSGPEGSPRGIWQGLRRAYILAMFLATTTTKPAFMGSDQIEDNFARVVPDCAIEECPIPIGIVATDLQEGCDVVFERGPLRDAVRASSAIAGVFPPVILHARVLVDGGYANLVPVETAFRMGADVVVAVDVTTDVADSAEVKYTGSSIHLRSTAILAEVHKKLLLRFADVVVKPDVRGIHWADFSAFDSMIALGEAAATKALPEIRAAIARARWVRATEILAHRRWSVDLRK